MSTKFKYCKNCGPIAEEEICIYWYKKYEKYYVRCRGCNFVPTKEQQARYDKKYYEKNKEHRALTSKKHQIKRRAQWVAWLIQNGYGECSECGYSKCFAAIEYHHEGEKNFQVAHFISRKCTEERQAVLKEELSKCKVLCANCHRELHNPQEE